MMAFIDCQKDECLHNQDYGRCKAPSVRINLKVDADLRAWECNSFKMGKWAQRKYWYGTAYADVDSFIVTNICLLDCGGTICALARNRKGDRKSFFLMYKGREVRPFRGN